MSKVGGVEKNILKKEAGGGGGGEGGHLEGLSIEWRLKPSVHCG